MTLHTSSSWQLHTSDWFFGLQELVQIELGIPSDPVVLAYVRNIPVSIVNFDFTLEFGPQHVNAKEELLAKIDLTKEYYTSHPVASVYIPVRFLTLDEYRAQVGEQLYHIDTNEGMLWPPWGPHQ